MVVRMGNTDDVNTWLLGMTSWLSHSMYSLVMQTLTKLELLKIKFSKLKHSLTDNAIWLKPDGEEGQRTFPGSSEGAV